MRWAPTTLGGNEEGAIERTEQRTTPPQTQTPAAVPRPDGEWTLQARGLTRRFGERLAVEDVSFHVAPGETSWGT